MNEAASLMSSTSIANMSDDQNIPMSNDSAEETAETPSVWYNVVISIDTNMILVTITTESRDKSVSAQIDWVFYAKHNRKQWLTGQLELDNEIDFKTVQVEHFKCRVLQMSTKTSHMKMNDMTYHTDLSH